MRGSTVHCPYCKSTRIRKNGKRRGKQNHISVNCERQFIDIYNPPKGYSNEIKQQCLKAYVNGSGFRAIERQKGVNHTTIIDISGIQLESGKIRFNPPLSRVRK